jgi:hypothetical protein
MEDINRRVQVKLSGRYGVIKLIDGDRCFVSFWTYRNGEKQEDWYTRDALTLLDSWV